MEKRRYADRREYMIEAVLAKTARFASISDVIAEKDSADTISEF